MLGFYFSYLFVNVPIWPVALAGPDAEGGVQQTPLLVGRVTSSWIKEGWRMFSPFAVGCQAEVKAVG